MVEIWCYTVTLMVSDVDTMGQNGFLNIYYFKLFYGSYHGTALHCFHSELKTSSLFSQIKMLVISIFFKNRPISYLHHRKKQKALGKSHVHFKIHIFFLAIVPARTYSTVYALGNGNYIS